MSLTQTTYPAHQPVRGQRSSKLFGDEKRTFTRVNTTKLVITFPGFMAPNLEKHTHSDGAVVIKNALIV